MPPHAARPIVVCLNRRAGPEGDRDTEDRIRALFRDRGRDVQIVPFDPSGRVPVEDASPRPLLVAAGGDGTVSAVASRAIESSSTLGVLPLGTLNHFARDLGIPTDLEKAVEVIVAGRTLTTDVGFINDRAFLNNCSVGVYPTVVQAREQLRRHGHRKWSAMLIAALRVLPHHHRLIVKLEADGDPAVWRTPFVLIANNAYKTSGLGFGARESLAGGRLFAYVAPAIRARQLPLAAVRAILLGAFGQSHTTEGHFEVVDASQLWLDAAGMRRVTVAIDGELSDISLPVHFRVAPRALCVAVPSEGGQSR